ncbi:hypothetical protein BCL57_001358 [Agromyces flavus]|uniref:Uncharacterized protein n=1 Tax=Agromyces flavus TaxID=589382 RepID=A0A1H1ZPR5_9MICO|nr:hypothetical protein [Agromyces flavus]MCP2367204.1 hypothetical protein [Agromyces flavus]GGI46195.1 hypothetical protein GCM10010932_13380 [Agromyces flavus]SDT35775.1 hypothetical protein SAMN04489721_3283 [Agromyces flavus]
MHARTIALSAAGLALAGTLGLATPATAAPNPVSPHASCVGQTFVPQAVGEPGAIAARIAEIKSFIPVSFGAVIGDFARWEDCSGD